MIKLPTHEPVRTLEDNAALRAKVKTLAEPKREFFKIDIGDGVQVDAYAVLPPKLDRSKKYPLFIYVYGEPAGQTTVNRWSGLRHVATGCWRSRATW